MFGEYSNRVARADFVKNLGKMGWKYFNMHSLNGIFVTNFNELSDEEKQGVCLEMLGDGISDFFGHTK